MTLLLGNSGGSGTKVALFLYSTANIVGSILAIAGVSLYLIDAIENYWALIVVGMYLAGYFAVPARNESAELGAERFNEDNILDALEETVKKIGPKLPEQARVKLASIKATMESLVPALKQDEQVDVKSRATIMSSVTRYLPQTLAAYLKLPPAFALVHQGASGKTAQVLLVEQLDALDAQLAQISKNIFNHDFERLIINGKFLEEKFSC